MPDKCDVCRHSNRLDMERAYLQGEAFLKISKTYDVAYHAVRNHMQNHLSRQIQQAYERKSLDESFDILSRIDNILAKTEDIFDRNYKKKRDGMALKAIGEQRNILELLSKISYAMHQSKKEEQQGLQQQNLQQQEQALSKAQNKLNGAELNLFFQLQDKLLNGTGDRVVVHESWGVNELKQPKLELEPEPPVPEPKVMQRTKKPKKSALKEANPKEGQKAGENKNVKESKENSEKIKIIQPEQLYPTDLF